LTNHTFDRSSIPESIPISVPIQN